MPKRRRRSDCPIHFALETFGDRWSLLILRDILVANTIDPNLLEDAKTMAAKAGLRDLLKFALIVVASGPVLAIYPFVQKYFVKGLMIGAIKG